MPDLERLREFVELTKKIEQAQQILEELKRQKMELEQFVIDEMLEEGLREMKTTNGLKVRIAMQELGTITDSKKFASWFFANATPKAKYDITISHEVLSAEDAQQLISNGGEIRLHWKTLSSLLREIPDVDSEKFGVKKFQRYHLQVKGGSEDASE